MGLGKVKCERINLDRIKIIVLALITKIKQHPQQVQQWVFIFLIAFTLLQTYHRSRLNIQKSQPYFMVYASAASIAISELHYDSEQGVGYLKIYDLFKPLIKWNVDWGPEFSVINGAIEQALNLEDVASEGIYYTKYEGLSTYYKVAFLIFGYKAESIFYLFWVLLIIPVVIFLITFYKQPTLLFFLLLFTCALFANSQTQGVLLQSIIRNRFLPILTILPAFYIMLLMFGQRKQDWITFMGVIGQTLVLILVMYTRPSSLYQLLFLTGASIILTILWYIQRKRSALNIPLKMSALSLWPLALIIVAYFALKYNLAPVHSDTITNRSCTWHMFYIGLGAHPKGPQEYGILGADMDAYNLVSRKAPELGYSGKVKDAISSIFVIVPEDSQEADGEIGWCDAVYEEIVKDEFFRIFRQDPWFVIDTYRYKLFTYVELYFEPLIPELINTVYANPAAIVEGVDTFGFGVINQLVDWPIIIVLILGIFLLKKPFWQTWSLPMILLGLQFLCALLIPLLFRPLTETIVDSALPLTIIILALFSATVWYGFHLIEIKWPNLKPFKLVYITFIVLLLVIILQGVFGYRPFKSNDDELFWQEMRFYKQPVDQVFLGYEGFYLILYQGKYYALAELGQVDLTNEGDFKECQARSQCFVGNSLEEVKVQVLLPRIVVKDFKGFDIIEFDYKFYLLSHALGVLYQDIDPVMLTNEEFMQTCEDRGQCFIGGSLKGTKELVDLMPKLVLEDYQGFDVVSYYNKFYVLSQTLDVFDEGFYPVVFTDEQFLQKCQDRGRCAIGTSLEEAKQLADLMPKLVLEDYQGFDVVSYYNKFYVLSQTLDVLDEGLYPVAFTDEQFLQECQNRGQCIVGSSLEEAKQSVKLLPKLIVEDDQEFDLDDFDFELVEEDYKRFYIIFYEDEFIALSQALGPLDQNLQLLLNNNRVFLLQECQVKKQCVISNSLEETQRLVDILTDSTQ